MNQTTKETRRRSYDAVLPKRAARCRLILETLGNRELTASEITEELDLILNGPTINGIKKDEVRAMLRETYTALKQYEKIGPMASPFINDPTAIVARAFSELYPGVE